MMRTDINLAIVAMVESAGAPAVDVNETNGDEMYCYDVSDVQNTTINNTVQYLLQYIMK